MIRPALRLVLALVVLGICLMGLQDPTQAGSGTSWQPDELNWYGISQRRINDTRADADLPLLAADAYLWSLAHERARDMHKRRYLAATTPEGLDAGAYMRQDGARYERWTEIRAEDATGQRQERVAWRVIDRILNDAGGRSNVLGPYDRLGVGMAEGKGRRVFVILIARAAPEEPPPSPAPRTIADIVVDAAVRHGIDADFFLSVARCESSLNPRALNPRGPYIGLFQFHPRTYAAFGGGNIYDPVEQAEVAARMFAQGLAFRHWECAHIVRQR
jgi:hypothetical protein